MASLHILNLEIKMELCQQFNSGYESVVNFRIVNQYLAVEGVNAVYTLRHGSDTVCVFNETLRGLTRNLTKKKK